MKIIPLSNGGEAIVDDEDFAFLSQWKWTRHPQGYATRTAYRRKVLMHREIAGAPPEYEVDHINRTKLDNRRSNLRLVDRSTNERNKGPQLRNTSGFKGVTWDKNRSKWVAKTRHRGRDRFIGGFDTAAAAAAAFDRFVADLD